MTKLRLADVGSGTREQNLLYCFRLGQDENTEMCWIFAKIIIIINCSKFGICNLEIDGARKRSRLRICFRLRFLCLCFWGGGRGKAHSSRMPGLEVIYFPANI